MAGREKIRTIGGEGIQGKEMEKEKKQGRLGGTEGEKKSEEG